MTYLDIYIIGAIIWFFIELAYSKGFLKAIWCGISWPFQMLVLLWVFFVTGPFILIAALKNKK